MSTTTVRLGRERHPTVGWYSSAAAQVGGTVVWLDAAGQEVVCTAVGLPGDSPYFPGSPSHADAEVVSTTLVRFLRRLSGGMSYRFQEFTPR